MADFSRLWLIMSLAEERAIATSISEAPMIKLGEILSSPRTSEMTPVIIAVDGERIAIAAGLIWLAVLFRISQQMPTEKSPKRTAPIINTGFLGKVNFSIGAPSAFIKLKASAIMSEVIK